jgi:hypothetical protein
MRELWWWVRTVGGGYLLVVVVVLVYMWLTPRGGARALRPPDYPYLIRLDAISASQEDLDPLRFVEDVRLRYEATEQLYVYICTDDTLNPFDCRLVNRVEKP